MAKDNARDGSFVELKMSIEKEALGEPAERCGETGTECPFLLEEMASLRDMGEVDGVPSNEFGQEEGTAVGVIDSCGGTGPG